MNVTLLLFRDSDLAPRRTDEFWSLGMAMDFAAAVRAKYPRCVIVGGRSRIRRYEGQDDGKQYRFVRKEEKQLTLENT